MAPTPQETFYENATPKETVHRPLTGNEVVISGLSGIFPKSNSVLEFMNNLNNKVDMVTADNPRWIFNHPEVPKHLGKVNGMSKFDAQFFRVHFKQACTMEPMSRKLLEHAYSAIYDSGINPLQLRGLKVGVFIGSTFSESERIVIYENVQRNGFGITGSNKAMYANRISYWIDGKGPSYALDVGCGSSMACLEYAYKSISSGQCDAAIVGGCNLCMQPTISLNNKRAGFLCMDGKSKCFDKNSDGYVRSDAISVLFLQKAKHAKRIYSEVYYVKGKYGLKGEGENFCAIREPKEIQEFLEAFYSEINVSPKDVEYIEGHGSANATAERNELQAIANVFEKDTPIQVGSVVSNMGHSEPAFGTCALTKVCLAYHQGIIPPNLHFNEPHDEIPAVREGKIQVVNEHTPFGRSFAALNCFSYTGVNIHVLLKGHYKEKDPERYKCNIPRMVFISGRQESSVNHVFGFLKNQPIDPEQIGLLHNIHENEIPGHMCRGYIILDSNEQKETVCVSESVEHFPGARRPLWLAYSGMGSQWPAMAAGLMRLPIFAAAVHRCQKALEPKGIDLIHILTHPDKAIYDNILHSFVGIAAVQIGLTDILRELGIVPDNIIGHSVGELGCAYADGCFTTEEMILAAYSRGLVSVQTPFIRGSMAAVGIGHQAVLDLCPPEIEVACHNSAESSTISGPADIMKEFVSDLTKRGIFAKEVPCSNIAYHSRYIAEAGPALLKYLSEVIKEPKERSPKWVSTSVPQDQWGEPKAKYSSAEYHTNNLLNAVLFEETSKLIPSNALVIEVAPHGLLQAILKRALSECVHVPLTRRGGTDPVKYLLEAIGKLYQAGLNPKLDILYPKIEYPVATGTSLLSHFVDWVHSEDWPEARYNTKKRVVATNRRFIMSIFDDDYKYFEGHVRDGLIMFPEAAILFLVWETLAMYKEVDYREMSVIFKDINFHGEAVIRKEVPLKFEILIYKGSYFFEVIYENACLVDGYIIQDNEPNVSVDENEEPVDNVATDQDIILDSNEIYRFFNQRGLAYRGEFQSVRTINNNFSKASVKWTGEWVTLLDSMIQINILAKNYDGLSTTKVIKSLTINPIEHNRIVENLPKGSDSIDVTYNAISAVTRCGGIQLKNIEFYEKPFKQQVPDVLQTKQFIPHFLTGYIDLISALQINLQIIADNVVENHINVVNLSSPSFVITNNAIKEAANKIPEAEFNMITKEIEDFSSIKTNKHVLKANVVIVDNLLSDEKKMNNLHSGLNKNTFVITIEKDTSKIYPKYKLFDVITLMSMQSQFIVLLKKADVVKEKQNIKTISIAHDLNFSWVPEVEKELRSSSHVILVSDKQHYCGLIGLVKRLKNKYQGNIRLVVIEDYHAPSFTLEDSLYQDQLQKQLVFNILKQGKWGSYYYVPSGKSTQLRSIKLTSAVPGELASLTWTEAATPSASKTSVTVHYAGPSVRDVQRVVGRVRDNKEFGMDFSGITNKGEKVMGLISGGALSSTVEVDSNLLWPVPQHWSLEDAATVPLPYIHAYYCLAIRMQLLKGMTVLVVGGAGALGQAALAVCTALGCTVYAAVSDLRKKHFLLKLFPTLDANKIGNSSDISFKDMVLAGTKNQRCDVVINCATGTICEAAMQCGGRSSIVFNVNDYDLQENLSFGMNKLTDERNFMSVNMSYIFEPENVNIRKTLQLYISEGIASGIIRPLTRVLYAPNDIIKAFRLLSQGKHRGRVLIRMRDPVTTDFGCNGIPIITYSPTQSQIVVCDEIILGTELIDRLVKRGAMNVLVQAEPNSLTGYFQSKLESWRAHGATIKLVSVNLQTEKGCVDLFSEGMKLGNVEGIFVAQKHYNNKEETLKKEDASNKFKETALVVANLDLISRNVCRELKYFVVLARSSENATDEYSTSVSERVCEMRTEVGLPALFYRVDWTDELSTNSSKQHKLQLQSYFSILNALETSLKLENSNVISFNLNKRISENAISKIETILGIKNINDVPDDVSLTDLGLYEVSIEEIKSVLKESYHIVYPTKTIKEMTIASLKNLKNDVMVQNTKFNSGLGAFYTFIDDDECKATEPMVVMPTKLNSTIENEEELDFNANFLAMIPGFEGHYSIFRTISERLRIQAMTFQLGPDLKDQTIPQMASNILTFVKKRFELKKTFYILGYSFGVNIALELAALMEKDGHKGIVFCLDSSPDALRVHLNAYVGNLSDSKLENAIIEHFYQLMAGKHSDELRKDLEIADTWPQKVEACTLKLKGLAHYSLEYKNSIFDEAYRRIKMAKEYEPNFKLESQLVLIRGIAHPKAENIAEDYNLSKYTKQPVKIFDIETDHSLAPNDCRISNIINSMLDSDLTEEYKKTSQCEVYYANAFKMF
ncbi:fatty acid synthase-like [Galleria mellonella]|uniref:Fatty acid synthase-like n=1 Tax=Galleria mellonella TaxID=7137 RepID=A0ABM3MBS0_GALME|nr:fatty acid synthase-like [Galleria mellonella]